MWVHVSACVLAAMLHHKEHRKPDDYDAELQAAAVSEVGGEQVHLPL